jgi:undecaprenyl-diphosphatase
MQESVDLLAAAVLGVVQGVTEFLPVSSSAHLILAREFFGWEAEFGLPFDVACHVGTLLAVVAYFRADIAAMVRAVPRAFDNAPAARRIRLIVVGTVPVVIVGGVIWSDRIEEATRTPAVAAVALLVGAVLLLAIERMGALGRGEEALTMPGAVAIGAAQALALIPGVSRSGATIAAGMALGLTRESAARFAFLLSMPAVAAAGAKTALGLRGMPIGSHELAGFAVGLVTSALVGYVTVKYFLQFLTRHRLDVFAWYRVGLALATFAWLSTR